MKIIVNFSPNYLKKMRARREIKFVIIHYTEMQSEIESIKRLKNPQTSSQLSLFNNKKRQSHSNGERK